MNIKADIVKMIKERGEFVTLEDGFVYYWPTTEVVHHKGGGYTSGGGAYSSAALRIIAEELDHLNKDWEEVLIKEPRI